MEPGHYTDPLEEALSHSSQRVAQFASLAGAMAQVVLQRRALAKARNAAREDESAIRLLDEQERLIHQQARLSWAPAHDQQWLARADLLQTARAWGGAACYADTDPAAASALRKCEDQLRTLHPYAMARYDRLREEGMSALDAMREAAPLFGKAPDVRVGDPAPAKPALDANPAVDLGVVADEVAAEQQGPNSEADDHDAAELRGRQIIERIQASARAAERPELQPAELAMVLEAVTNLPEDVIGKLTLEAAAEDRARSEERRAVEAERARAAGLNDAIDLGATPLTNERTAGLMAAQPDTGIADTTQAQARADRSAAQLAAESFPQTAADAVQAAAAGAGRPAHTSARVAAPEIAKRNGPAL